MKWETIRDFSQLCPRNPYHKEQENVQMDIDTPRNVHVLARAELTAEKIRPPQYFLDISADDYYKLYVNGHYAGEGPAPAYPEYYYYNTVDITPWLTEGKNVLAVHLYYQGLVNRVWNSGDGRFALAAELRAQPAGSETKRTGAASDAGTDIGYRVETERRENGTFQKTALHWKYQISHARYGEPVGYDTQYLENFDSRLWDEDWAQPGFDDESWPEMEAATWADYRLRPQPTKMISVDERKPAVVKKMGENRWFVDAGHEVAGGLLVTARGHAGGRVVLTYGEELEERPEAVRFRMRCNCDYREEWTIADGVSHYEPYGYKGFRYAEIAADAGIEIADIRIRVRHYPMDEGLSGLVCSDPYVGRIFEICRRAVMLGTQEGYLDCPTREKGQYLGDAVITSRAQVWLTGKTDMLRKCIDQFAHTQTICPGLMGVAPGSFMQEIADFSLLFPQLLLTDYQFTGDRAFLKSYYPAAKKMLEYFARYERADGLLDGVSEKWNLVDWPENLRDGYEFPLTRPVVARGCHNVINALYVGAIKTVAKVEEILLLPQTCGWERQKRAFVRVFYREDRGLFADSEHGTHCSLHANLYPLYFGLAPRGAEDGIARFLAGRGLTCGTMTSYFLLKGLAEAGYHGEVYRLITNTGSNGWVNMLREGASTCFEVWGKEQKWNTSLCHPWSSAPVSLLIEEIAGIRLAPERLSGYEFLPHIPEETVFFTLKIPFRGRLLYVQKQDGAVSLADCGNPSGRRP